MQIQNKIKYLIRSKDPVSQIQQCKEVLPRIYQSHYYINNDVHATDMSKPFHFLVDMKTNRIMLATHNHELVRVLSRTPNTFQLYNLTISKIPGCKDWNLNDNFDFEFPWNSIALDMQFFDNKSIDSDTLLNAEQIYHYYLIQCKAKLLNMVLGVLESMRLDCNISNNTYQESIYREKYEQALKVVENIIYHDYENQYYYVSDWAAVKGLDLLSAAKDIKINHELMHHRLSKIEYARLMIIDKIRNETEIGNLETILSDFRMFNFGYLKL